MLCQHGLGYAVDFCGLARDAEPPARIYQSRKIAQLHALALILALVFGRGRADRNRAYLDDVCVPETCCFGVKKNQGPPGWVLPVQLIKAWRQPLADAGPELLCAGQRGLVGARRFIHLPIQHLPLNDWPIWILSLSAIPRPLPGCQVHWLFSICCQPYRQRQGW